ncbi:unnamed protein product [Urochloa decumbens]|uniref:F-box domain-containing protein n=1 Tax=Urochloa decumbens TaxID=240449 RepID=A0ABC9E607_9POAL
MASKRTTRRRAGKEESIINCLPTELIEHVFFSLPASCLLQCTSVCKKWRKIIRDSQFALAHLQHASSCMLLFSPQGSISGKLYPSDAIIFDEAWSPSKLAVPVIGPDDRICGSCNGLLCLHTPTSTIKIANLATGECLHLKKPTKSLKDRFGFHPATKEYMVIHFSQESSPLTVGRFNVIQLPAVDLEDWTLCIGDDRHYWITEIDGKNFEIELTKMVKLLDLSPRGEDGMQFYVFVKSLVPLDVYAMAAIVHRPKRFGEWRLKKWKAWEQERVTQEDAWRRILQKEHEWMAHRGAAVMEIKETSQGLPDGIQAQISMEMDRILQHLQDCPDQHRSPAQQRLNWVEMMQERKKLSARLERHKASFQVMEDSLDRAISCLSQ